MTETSPPRSPRILDGIYYAFATGFFLYLFGYYWTSEGGPTLLAMTLVPITFVLFTLSSLRANDLYPRLPRAANYTIAVIYVICALAVSYYLNTEYMDLGTARAGAWEPLDMFMGGLMTLLVLEYSRKRHMPLFILNLALILYAVYGYLVPGMFYHAGLSWTRVLSAMSLETTTGVFSNLPQLALTIIGSFLLVLAVLSGFGCIESLLRTTKRVASRSAHALPQSAVVGSMCVGTVSGSGAANAITIGSATIPAMIGAGMPRATAAAIESASSLGGQLMPPVMGVSAFLMAEFLGRSYFDVVARGYAPALVYYITVAVSVYLLAIRYRTKVVALSFERLTWPDWVNLAAFLAVIELRADEVAEFGLDRAVVLVGVFHDLAGDFGVLLEGFVGGVNHDAGEPLVNALLAQLERVAVVQMHRDGHGGKADGGLDELLEIHRVGVFAGALGNLEDQRGLLLFAGLDDRLDEFHVVDVEGAEGVFALEGLGEQVACVCQWHSSVAVANLRAGHLNGDGWNIRSMREERNQKMPPPGPFAAEPGACRLAGTGGLSAEGDHRRSATSRMRGAPGVFSGTPGSPTADPGGRHPARASRGDSTHNQARTAGAHPGRNVTTSAPATGGRLPRRWRGC